MVKIIIIVILMIIVLLTACTEERVIDFGVYENDGIISMLKTEDIMILIEYKDVIFAGGSEGVYKISRTDESYSTEKLVFSRNITYVKSLFIDEDKMWIGNEDGIIIYNLVDNTEEHYNNRNSFLPDNRVNSIYKSSEGIIWIGTWGGACYLKDGNWSMITRESGLVQENVNVIYEDHFGGMWLGSYAQKSGGVSYLFDGKIRTFQVKDGLSNENITSIFEDSDHILWIGGGMYTQGGAVGLSYDGLEWKITESVSQEKGLAGAKVRSIFQDSKGRLYFGSEYDGLSIYDKGKWSYINEDSGLVQNEVKTMIEDSEGNIWIGTRYGISVFLDI